MPCSKPTVTSVGIAGAQFRNQGAPLLQQARLAVDALNCLVTGLSGRLGESSEWVVKRCVSRLLGLPADSLQNVPLKDLAARFRTRPALPGGRAQGYKRLELVALRC